MDTELLTILPNLSIGVVSISGLVFITIRFIDYLKEERERQEIQETQRAERHESAMKERELALREVEKEVRTNILSQLSKNTEIMNDTSKVMERAIMILDKGK
jgi:uncharacterized protein (DUF39 family)